MRSLRKIHLNGLRAVEAVGRLGSLRAAAEEMGVSPGAVSQQIARCEAALDCTLFDRRPGGMVPSADSADIFRLLGEGFARLASAVDLTQRDRSHVLTISTAPIFAARWFIWRLPAFTRAHPDIKVRIDSNSALVDLRADDVDFGIRIGKGPYAGVKAEWLMDQRMVPVCSPDWAARIAVPEDLARVPVIREPEAMFGWDCWLTPEGLSPGLLGEGPEFSDASLCLDAAMAGEGLFLAFEVLCRDALDRGQVVAPIPRFHKSGLSYWLISREDRSLSAPQRLFRNWLHAAIAEGGLGTAPPVARQGGPGSRQIM